MRKEDYTIFEYRMSKEIKYADLAAISDKIQHRTENKILKMLLIII